MAATAVIALVILFLLPLLKMLFRLMVGSLGLGGGGASNPLLPHCAALNQT